MFALTIRESGDVLGTFEIPTDVCRVGSHQPDGLQIDGLEPHALTIQLRDDGYHVFNRTERTLRLHRRNLAPGERVVWKPGQVLKIAPVELELSVIVSQNDDRAGNKIGSAANVEAKSSIASSLNNRMPALMMLGIVGLVLMMMSGESTNSNRDKTFCDIVEKLHEAPTDRRLSTVKSSIQTAYDLQARGSNQLAAEHFKLTRRTLRSERPKHDELRSNASVRRLEKETLDFVNGCLKRL